MLAYTYLGHTSRYLSHSSYLYDIFGPDTRLSGSELQVIISLENDFCEMRTIVQQFRKTLQAEN